MGYKFREEHPPRQRLTLELVAVLATFLVVVGVWTRTVVLGDPTPTPAVAAETRPSATTHPTRHLVHAHRSPKRADLRSPRR
jgi:hypothetical protein